MSLSDEKHTEAWALLNRLVQDFAPVIPYRAVVEFWLDENRPEPERCTVALNDLATRKAGTPDESPESRESDAISLLGSVADRPYTYIYNGGPPSDHVSVSLKPEEWQEIRDWAHRP